MRSGARKELLGPWAGLAAAGGEERGGGGGGGKSNDACNYSASHDTVLGGRDKKVVSLSLSLGRLTRFDRSGGRGGIIWSSPTTTTFLKSGEEFVMIFVPLPPRRKIFTCVGSTRVLILSSIHREFFSFQHTEENFFPLISPCGN